LAGCNTIHNEAHAVKHTNTTPTSRRVEVEGRVASEAAVGWWPRRRLWWMAMAVIEVTVRVARLLVTRANPDLVGRPMRVDPDAPWLQIPNDL
jgi:hypothetical protein